MRNFVTAISATLTAIVLGLLIANVASAAHAAELKTAQDAQAAADQDTAYQTDMATQLKAYQTRYGQTYQQLSATYQAYYQRDAEYRQIVANANANAAALASANASLESRLNEAYAALRDAQALVAQLRAQNAVQTPPQQVAPIAPQQPAQTPQYQPQQQHDSHNGGDD